MQEYLFKFPSVVKLHINFGHLKSSDVLQFLSFLYCGHAIISNSKRSYDKFLNLIKLLLINNLNYKETHDGRLILQTLLQTPFECPPNTITFDFDIDVSRKEPHVVLNHDERFNLSNVLNSVTFGKFGQRKNVGSKSVGMIGIDGNGDMFFEPNQENGREVDQSLSSEMMMFVEGEGVDADMSQEHAYFAGAREPNNEVISKDNRGGVALTKPSALDGKGHQRVQQTGSKSLQDCNFSCESVGDGTAVSDNFDIVDNEVVIETSTNETFDLSSHETEKFTEGESTKYRTPYRGNNKHDRFDWDGINQLSVGFHLNMNRTNNFINGGDSAHNETPSDLYNGPNKLDVDFDADFKPIVIQNNSKTNFSIVKTGKCLQNNCYVTVLEQEEYEDTQDSDSYKENQPKRNGERERLSIRNHTSDDVGGYEKTKIDTSSEQTRFTELKSEQQHCTPENVRYSYSDDKITPSVSMENGQVDKESDGKGAYNSWDCYSNITDDSNEGSLDSSVIGIVQQHTGDKKTDNCPRNNNEINKRFGNNHLQTELTRNGLSTLRHGADRRFPVMHRNNIELLIEASALVDISVDMSRTSSSQIRNGNTNGGSPNNKSVSYHRTPTSGNFKSFTVKADRNFVKSSSRPKRKQTLNERAYDSDDIDFFEPLDQEVSRNQRSKPPFRKSLRRLDFNTFSYKRFKTEENERFVHGKLPVAEGKSSAVTSSKAIQYGNKVGNIVAKRSGSGIHGIRQIPSVASPGFDCSRTMDSFLLSHRPGSELKTEWDRVNSGDTRNHSAERDRLTLGDHRNHSVEAEAESGDDSEATLSVEEFATSAGEFEL